MTDKNNKNGGKIILQEGETTITDNHQIANIFNDYFSNIASNIGFNDDITSARDAIIDHQNHPSILKIREKYAIKDDAFDFNPVSEELIDMKLRSINNRKSQGYDNIPGKLLRLAHAPLAPHLTYLVNLCFRTATFANNLKNAELSPIHKKEDIWIKQITDPSVFSQLCPNCTRALWMINFGNILWIYLMICCVHIVKIIVVNLFWLKWSMTGKSYLTKITLLRLFLWTCRRHSTAYPMDLLPQSFELTV